MQARQVNIRRQLPSEPREQLRRAPAANTGEFVERVDALAQGLELGSRRQRLARRGSLELFFDPREARLEARALVSHLEDFEREPDRQNRKAERQDPQRNSKRQRKARLRRSQIRVDSHRSSAAASDKTADAALCTGFTPASSSDNRTHGARIRASSASAMAAVSSPATVNTCDTVRSFGPCTYARMERSTSSAMSA